MATETRASSRIQQNPVATLSIGTGQTVTRRISLTTTAEVLPIPNKIVAVVFKNIGPNEIRIRINAAGANFWTLATGELMPKILINNSVVEAQSIGGNSILECLLEG